MSTSTILFRVLIFSIAMVLLPGVGAAQVIVFSGKLVNAEELSVIPDANIQVIDKYTEETLFESKTSMEGTFSIKVPASERIFMRISADHFHPLVLSFQELSGRHLENNTDIALMPLQRGMVYTYQLSLPAGLDLSGATLAITNENKSALIQEHVFLESNAFTTTLKRGKLYDVAIKGKGILARSWKLYWPLDGEAEMEYSFSMKEDKHSNHRDKNGVAILSHTIGIIKRKIDAAFEIDGLDYELSESYISPKSGLALDNIARIIKANPDILFEIGNHSKDFDDQHADLDLSMVRAHIAADYLIELKDIPYDQIVPRGYGNVQMPKECPGRRKCKGIKIFKEHQHNRTFLKIIGFREKPPVKPLPKPAADGLNPTIDGVREPKPQKIQDPIPQMAGNQEAIIKNYSGKAVQLMVVRQPLPKSHALSSDSRVIISRRDDNGLAYIAVPVSARESISEMLSTYRENYKDAFVVNLKDGKRIP